MLAAHVDTKQNLAVEAEAALEAGQAPGQREVGEDVILGSVEAVQRLVAQSALVHVTLNLQLVIRVEALYALLFN